MNYYECRLRKQSITTQQESMHMIQDAGMDIWRKFTSSIENEAGVQNVGTNSMPMSFNDMLLK